MRAGIHHRQFAGIGAGFQFLLTFALRFSYRFYLARVARLVKGVKYENVKNVMLIGAGEAGQLILRDLQKNDPRRKVVCIIDDNPNKHGRFIEGVCESPALVKTDRVGVVLHNVQPEDDHSA